MLNITDFIKQNQLLACPITYNDKNYDPVYEWQKKSFDELQQISTEDKNGFMVKTMNNDKRFVILDTDNKRADDFVKQLIKDNNLNTVSTPSYKHLNQQLTFNNHYWFELPKDFIFETQKKIKDHFYYGNLDILNQIAINKNNKINTNISIIPNNVLSSILEDNKVIDLLSVFTKDFANDYEEWGNVGMALKAISDDNLDLFDAFSQTKNKYKGYKDVTKRWYGFSSCDNGMGLLVNMAKENNEVEYKKWNKKYGQKDTKKSTIFDDEFWNKLQDMNHSDFAKMYKELIPNKYIVSKNKDWYEYNKYNVLINQMGIPSSLTNNITDTLQDLIIKKRNELIPTSKDYDEKMKLVKKAYQNLGNAPYIKGVIEYLEHLYLNIDLDDLIDANTDLLAFNDKVYDVKVGEYRDIKPTDYITKTTKTNAPTEVNDAKIDEITNLLLSIFGKESLVKYWLKTTGLSLFTNKFESLYILTGTGGNGKGLLSNILNKILGDYIYTASNTFLTEKIKGGQANSTLAKCKGIRYLLVSEPDDGSNDAEFNVEFIKMITGGDMITTRDLYKSNFSFKPQFTPFVQCNKKPKLGKMDNGIKRRLKIHNYPFEFVETITKPNQKQANTNLKSSMDQEFYDNFILLLLQVAHKNININKIEQPQEVINETADYFDSNNPVKSFIDARLETSTTNIKMSELWSDYQYEKYELITKTRFKDDLIHNGLKVETKNGNVYVFDVKLKEKPKEPTPSHFVD